MASISLCRGLHATFVQTCTWPLVGLQPPVVAPDDHAIEAYLTRIFRSVTRTLMKTPLDVLKDQVNGFRVARIDIKTLITTIKALLNNDLLSGEKSTALIELQNNELALAEMADGLNRQIRSLETWSWGEEPVPARD